MRFRIQTDIFRKAIESANHATSTSNLTPILENILISAEYKRLVLTGNNLDMAIEYIIEDGVEIEAEGTYTISSKFLTSYVSLVQDEEISVSLEKNGSVAFTTKTSETKFKGTSSEKFPTIPKVTSNQSIVLDAKDFKKAIEKTIFSTADGNVRPMLAGIYMKSADDMLIFASTDSFRLSEFQVKPKHAIKHDAIIIPEKTATEISRLIGDATSIIELFTHETQLLVIIDKIRLTSRLLAGKFPDYQSFFPDEWWSKTTLLRSELINALKQANLVARENNFNTRIRSKHEGAIEVSTGDTEVGASLITLAWSVEWQEDIIGINSEYFLHALWAIRDDYVSFEYKNPLSPIVIKWVASDSSDQSYRHLIMPLKI